MKTIEIYDTLSNGERVTLARITLDNDTVKLEVLADDLHPIRDQLWQVLSGPPDWRRLGPVDGREYWDAVLREFRGRVEFL